MCNISHISSNVSVLYLLDKHYNTRSCFIRIYSSFAQLFVLFVTLDNVPKPFLFAVESARTIWKCARFS